MKRNKHHRLAERIRQFTQNTTIRTIDMDSLRVLIYDLKKLVNEPLDLENRII